MNLEVRPNFTSEAAATAEKNMQELLDRSTVLGVEISPPALGTNEIIDIFKRKNPGRLIMVTAKLKNEGIDINHLTPQEVLDRLLGVDFVFDLEGKRFSVDVTTGKDTVIYNKRRKAEGMEDISHALGINHAIILRLKEEISDDLILDFFSQLEQISQDKTSNYCSILKYSDRN